MVEGHLVWSPESGASSCDTLLCYMGSAELREACGGLVMRKKETEAEIEGCKEQIR